MQLKKFSPAAQKVLIQCQALAKKKHNHLVEPEHLALALVMAAEVRELLDKKKLDYKSLESALLESISKLPINLAGETSFSGRLIQALSAAEALSISKNHETILVSDMLLSVLENKNKYGSLGAVLAQYFLDERDDNNNKHNNQLNNQSKASFFDFVDQINPQVKNNILDPVFGREDECDRVVQVLSRKSRNNALLIGEPGVGRTSIVYALVKRIVEQKVPSFLITKEILSLDVGALVAGTTLRGQFEERLRKVLSELAEKPGQYILLVRDLSSLIGAGGDGASDAANLIKPSLLKGDIQMIGLVSPDLYKKRIEKDPSFDRFFQPIWIEQPNVTESHQILIGLKNNYERFHGVFIEDDALSAAIDLGAKHLSGRVLPEVALDILDEACARHRIAIDKKPEKLSKIAELILEQEMALSTLEAQKSPKAAKLKAQKSLVAKLVAEERQIQEHYEEELSLIESMRALKGEIFQAERQMAHEREHKNPTGAANIANNQLASLTALLKKKSSELDAIKKSARLIEPWVKRDDIAFIVSQETGIPVQKMLQSEREKLATMESILGSKVIGQETAVSAVSAAIRRARVGLKDPKKPIGSFLFLGPTGVGKTELARTLTSFLFDDERSMLRFDMSEFMERHSVARLIGAPPGYQGSDEGGQLTEAVRHKPFSVVLFDEIEKAHVDVLNVLLQVLDEGRLTDSKGRLVHFNNTVIIMTSNVGSDILLNHDNQSKDQIREKIMELLLKLLRPELVNRIDEIVIFDAIDKTGIKGIAELMLKSLEKRMASEGYELSISEPVKARLIEEGYSRDFGARPLKRTIQRLIETPLATLLVASKFKKGDHIEAKLDKASGLEIYFS